VSKLHQCHDVQAWSCVLILHLVSILYQYGSHSDKAYVKTIWTHYPTHLPRDSWKVRRIRMAFQLNIKKLTDIWNLLEVPFALNSECDLLWDMNAHMHECMHACTASSHKKLKPERIIMNNTKRLSYSKTCQTAPTTPPQQKSLEYLLCS
jgi:hypothetical protein